MRPVPRTYLPVLKGMPSRYIHEPWLAPKSVQKAAKCIVGELPTPHDSRRPTDTATAHLRWPDRHSAVGLSVNLAILPPPFFPIATAG